jgi:hypothetical protein
MQLSQHTYVLGLNHAIKEEGTQPAKKAKKEAQQEQAAQRSDDGNAEPAKRHE